MSCDEIRVPPTILEISDTKGFAVSQRNATRLITHEVPIPTYPI